MTIEVMYQTIQIEDSHMLAVNVIFLYMLFLLSSDRDHSGISLISKYPSSSIRVMAFKQYISLCNYA